MGARVSRASDHERAERRSLALHRAVAARLREEPALLDPVRARLRVWLASEADHPYARAWQERIDGPLQSLLDFLEENTQEARDLRQASPFAGVLSARERWRVLRELQP